VPPRIVGVALATSALRTGHPLPPEHHGFLLLALKPAFIKRKPHSDGHSDAAASMSRLFAAPRSTIAANLAVQPYDPATYIETAKSGNRVSRRAHIYGSQNIVLGGKCIIPPAVVIRGDLRKAAAPAAPGSDAARAERGSTVAISMNKFCVLGEGCVLRPPYKTYRGLVAAGAVWLGLLLTVSACSAFTYYPLKMGEYVSIGAGSIVEAASIGSYVDIGRGCVVVRGALSAHMAFGADDPAQGKFCSIKDSVRVLDGSVLPAGTVLPSGTVWGGAPGQCLCVSVCAILC
jgi:dynactin-5